MCDGCGDPRDSVCSGAGCDLCNMLCFRGVTVGVIPLTVCVVGQTVGSVVELAVMIRWQVPWPCPTIAATSRLAMRLKMEASFDHRVKFLAVALAENRRVVPALAKMRLKTLPLTQGTLFAGKCRPPVESSGKAQLLCMTQAQLARDQPAMARTASGHFWIPFKKWKKSKDRSKKEKKGADQSSSSEGTSAQHNTGRGRGRGLGGGKGRAAKLGIIKIPLLGFWSRRIQAVGARS